MTAAYYTSHSTEIVGLILVVLFVVLMLIWAHFDPVRKPDDRPVPFDQEID